MKYYDGKFTQVNNASNTTSLTRTMQMNCTVRILTSATEKVQQCHGMHLKEMAA